MGVRVRRARSRPIHSIRRRLIRIAAAVRR